MIKKVAICFVCGSFLCSCASKQGKTDWTDLVQQATPEFRKGACGSELVWKKDVSVYETVVVEGQLLVKKKCADR